MRASPPYLSPIPLHLSLNLMAHGLQAPLVVLLLLLGLHLYQCLLYQISFWWALPFRPLSNSLSGKVRLLSQWFTRTSHQEDPCLLPRCWGRGQSQPISGKPRHAQIGSGNWTQSQFWTRRVKTCQSSHPLQCHPHCHLSSRWDSSRNPKSTEDTAFSSSELSRGNVGNSDMDTASRDCLSCSDTDDASVQTVLRKYRKRVQASCKLSKSNIWMETQQKRINDSHQDVWGNDHKINRTEQKCILMEDHTSFEMRRMITRTNQLLHIAEATGSKIYTRESEVGTHGQEKALVLSLKQYHAHYYRFYKHRNHSHPLKRGPLTTGYFVWLMPIIC